MLPGICLPHCTPRMSPGSGLPGNLQGQRGRTNSVPLGERTGEHPDEDVRLKSPHSNIWNSESFKNNEIARMQGFASCGKLRHVVPDTTHSDVNEMKNKNTRFPEQNQQFQFRWVSNRQLGMGGGVSCGGQQTYLQRLHENVKRSTPDLQLLHIGQCGLVWGFGVGRHSTTSWKMVDETYTPTQ